MTRSVLLVAGTVAAAAAVASGQRTLRPLEGGIAVEPLRIAPAVFGPDGARMAGDWMAYEGAGSIRGDTPVLGCDHTLVFDCIEHTGTCQDEGYFSFGTGYCNMFWTNDMTVGRYTDLAYGAPRVDFAWLWTAGGSGTSEYCIIAVFVQDSVPCDSDSLDYPGWLLDFGTLASSVGAGYFYSEVDIRPEAWPLPSNGVGSYCMFYLQAITTSGAWVLATCAQPMLWGTGEDRGDPDAPGRQGPLQFDDDDPVDGDHDAGECHSYADLGLCPTELGGAVGFWGSTCDPGCYWLFPNGDGNDQVDTRDFVCFLGRWAGAMQSGGYDPEADCDQDASITTQDFLCFLNRFVVCYTG
ncbi:MAG: hypothetical protein IT431_02780 [Phycisphaerales bacterium]|nr:hypothetical protein [Phycisphaerales bacterium]